MNEFVKVFNSEKLNTQICVMLDVNDDGAPSVFLYFTPNGLGVCRMSLSFTDSDEGWDKADHAFASIDKDKAESMVGETLDGLGLLPVVEEE